MNVTINTNNKFAKFIKDHKKELIIGGIVMAGSVIIATKAHKAGFAKGVAATKFANDADCALHVTPKLWGQYGRLKCTHSSTDAGRSYNRWRYGSSWEDNGDI